MPSRHTERSFGQGAGDAGGEGGVGFEEGDIGGLGPAGGEAGDFA